VGLETWSPSYPWKWGITRRTSSVSLLQFFVGCWIWRCIVFYIENVFIW
jgi:hypothetical protein